MRKRERKKYKLKAENRKKCKDVRYEKSRRQRDMADIGGLNLKQG